ncbi:MAG: helix-turn-helix transcriptional regulator [Gallionella sp.]|nr:helix-turn-helix transcriptional regulator [Gallionella sp.]
MAKKTSPLLPSTAELLYQLGDRLRLARLRRKLTSKQVAERAGMSPMTLRSVERGGDGVTMGAYLAVMQVLGIEQDINLLGQADTLGRDLQDARLLPKTKPSAKLYAKLPTPSTTPQLNEPIQNYTGFTSSQTLANLIDPAAKQNG